ncbi:S9 family peptidase [Thermosipho sp. 1063]|uniref:alpha/beta hydrolase family protein n=1 Tax=Thermosipho sp. 1063 TaxID=1462747 RepID=UPI00095246DA|nr:alpha/beta hydrolase [Thermosipho sp. 1063]
MINIKAWFKFLVYLSLFVISFFNFTIAIFIFFILQIPIVKRSVLGKLPFNLDRKSWLKKETYKYKENLWLDLYYPKIETNNVVLFAHGGGWISGYRRQPNNVSWYRYLVSKGFIVATIDYRYGYLNEIDVLVEDIFDAYRFIKNMFPLSKVSLMGLSAGGHLALYFGLKYKPSVENIVSYYTPCDLLDIWKSSSLFARFAVSTTLKRLPVKSKDVYIKYSPITYVNKDAPPILLVHGLKDSVVPYFSSVKMYKKLREKGNNAKLLLHPFGDHGFEFVLKDEKTKDILEETIKFLRGDLK